MVKYPEVVIATCFQATGLDRLSGKAPNSVGQVTRSLCRYNIWQIRLTVLRNLIFYRCFSGGHSDLTE
jgi:hypothetical protein